MMKNLRRGRKKFGSLTARFARDILEQLRERHDHPFEFDNAFTSKEKIAQSPPDEQRYQVGITAPRPVFTVEIDQPELAGYCIFMPQRNMTKVSDWGVMAESNFSYEQNSGIFELVAILEEKLDDRSFVSLGYTYFLHRLADEQGLREYTQALQRQRIDRRGVMKSILTSGEALRLKKRIVLVPDPGSWLNEYIPGYSANDPFPLLEVRY